MNRIASACVAAALICPQSSTSLKGDGFVAPSLGESWFIVADTPELAIFRGQLHENGYHYQAASANGFNISAFVEQPATESSSHADCFEYYWPKMKRNPLIDTDSIEIVESNHFVKVSYAYKGIPDDSAKHHVNYYVAHNQRWIDIHISMNSELPRDQTIKKFEESLQFRPFSPSVEDATNISQPE